MEQDSNWFVKSDYCKRWCLAQFPEVAIFEFKRSEDQFKYEIFL